MTHKELNKKIAKQLGIYSEVYKDTDRVDPEAVLTHELMEYNPFRDITQAIDLAIKYEISIMFGKYHISLYVDTPDGFNIYEASKEFLAKDITEAFCEHFLEDDEI